ncbi:MAG: ORF6N domain-containing protein [Crocinitomicaceae bacterium]|nr:ORF6N domain-containing protein [Crocinitomicaceae bacterium]MBK8927672.1 ORF6N domain-containing protein [Crocinitomicaceae bacterium]
MTEQMIIPDERLLNKIYLIRGQKVMLDRDLAELYGVETKRLKEQVKRNIKRFPGDFMFEMSQPEFEIWRSQFATSKSDKQGLRHKPFCFTEHGVLMLSSVLSSERAIEVNIRIMRLFNQMREMILSNKDMLKELEGLREKINSQDERIELVFDYLTKLITKQETEPERVKIGFKK